MVSVLLVLSPLLICASSAGEQPGVEEVIVAEERDLAEEIGATVIDVRDHATSDDLAEVLRGAPGLTVRSLGGVGAWSGVSIRGSSYRQVLVHLDGVPLNPDGIDAVNLTEIPLAALAQVRVWRGLAPIRYGSGAMGGVIDLISPVEAESPPVVRVGIGSLHTLRASISGGGRVGEGDGFVAVDALHTEGDFLHLSDAGTRFVSEDDAWRLRANNDKLQVAVHGRVRQQVGDWQISLLEAAVLRQEGLPGPIGDPALDVRLRTARSLTTLSLQGVQGPIGLIVRGWYLGRRDALDDRAGELGVGSSWAADGFHTAGGWSSARGEPSPWLALTGIVHGRWERYQGRDLIARVTGEPADRGVIGTAVEATGTWWSDRVGLTLALDARGIAAGSASSWSGLLPRASLAVSPTPGFALQAQAGATFRPPTLTELYGDRGAVVGNPDLQPERATAVELGAAVRGPWGRHVQVEGELVGYSRWVRDLVVYVQNAQRTMVPQSFGRARILGLEAALALKLGGVVESRTSLTLQDPRNRTDDPAVHGRLLPSTPRVQLDQQTTIRYGERLEVGHRLHHLGATFFDATNWLISAPRWLHSVHVRLTPWAVGPSFELAVLNLTNVRTHEVDIDPLQPAAGTMTTAVTDLVGYPLPGRTVMGSIVWRPPLPGRER